jgi:hypothetical protein
LKDSNHFFIIGLSLLWYCCARKVDDGEFNPNYGTQEPSFEDSFIPSTKPDVAVELGREFRIDMSGRFPNPFLSNLLPRTS